MNILPMPDIACRRGTRAAVHRTAMALCGISALCVAGCATGTMNPVFNSSAEKAHIYSAEENKGGFGVPPAMVGATGKVRYCAAGTAALVEARKQQALAAMTSTPSRESS
jgi:hypothetical protein